MWRAQNEKEAAAREAASPAPRQPFLLSHATLPTHHSQDPLFAPVYDQSLADFRELTLRRLVAYVRAKNANSFFSVRDYVADPCRFMAGLETLAMADYSLCIKVCVCERESVSVCACVLKRERQAHTQTIPLLPFPHRPASTSPCVAAPSPSWAPTGTPPTWTPSMI